MIALKNKLNVTKRIDHGFVEHTAKTVARVIRTRIERKVEDILEVQHLGFRREKGNRNAIGKVMRTCVLAK
jgi:hypothetical protein